MIDGNLLHTIKPSIVSIITNPCTSTCNIMPNSNKCYWYESQNLAISCISNNEYCCSHSRNECCQTDVKTVYIVFGSLFLAIIILTLLAYKKSIWVDTRVTPIIPPIENNNVKDKYNPV